jgi:predicted NUDIX family NTP pyrophosphohydrolase
VKRSAGILAFRWIEGELQVFLVHPGGPFWKNKDDGAWSIPKGEHADDEDPLAAAKREFTEETGIEIDGRFTPLGSLRQNARKEVSAWAVEGSFDGSVVRSNNFRLEWPPKSGKFEEFPEVDRAGWFSLKQAKIKVLPGQQPFLERLGAHLGIGVF